MQRDGSRSVQATVGEIGAIKAQLHFLEHGYNIAMPIIPDGTDMIAYDHGCVWQLQIKTVADMQRTKYVDLRPPQPRRSSSVNRYAYIDAYIVVDLAGDNIWTLPAAWTPPGAQVHMRTLSPISASILRHIPINCDGLHPWPGSCAECNRCHASMSDADTAGVSTLLNRGRKRVAKIAANEKGPTAS